MHITIHNHNNGRSTLYTMPELKREAKTLAHMAKGRLIDFYVEAHEPGNIVLCAQVRYKNGLGEIVRTAL